MEWKFPIFTKISISKTIASSPAARGIYAASSEGYDGLKYMLYFNYRVKGPWFIHLLYKVHIMEGPDKLSTNRTGIGFGYNLK